MVAAIGEQEQSAWVAVREIAFGSFRTNCQMVQASADRVELLADVLSAHAKPVPEYEPESRQTVGPLIFFERAASAIR